MGLAWTIVGLITGLSALAYVELAKRYRLDWKAWTGLILGEFLLLFCIAWCRYLCPLHKNTMEGLFDRCRKNLKKPWLNRRPQRAD